jgi:hypothetical protein
MVAAPLHCTRLQLRMASQLLRMEQRQQAVARTMEQQEYYRVVDPTTPIRGAMGAHRKLLQGFKPAPIR